MMYAKELSRGMKRILPLSQQTVKRGVRVETAPRIDDEKIMLNDFNEVPSSKVRPFNEIPGPRVLSMIGNMLRSVSYIGAYSKKSFKDEMNFLKKLYGPIIRVDLLSRAPIILLFEPELVEKMYRLQGKWPTRMGLETLTSYRENNPDFYQGEGSLTSSQGKEWHDFRSKVNPHMMQPRAVKPHIEQINEITEDFLSRMRAIRNPETLELPSSFNNELNKWALEGTCAIALNHRLGCLDPNLAKDSEPQTVINCVREILQLAYKLETKPSFWKLFNTPNLRKMFEMLNKVNGIADKYVMEAAKQFKEKPSLSPNERSLLEKLLLIDERTARIMSLDMFMAGVDTTSTGAGALLYFLASNPKKQEKLRNEVNKVLPTKDSPVTADCLNNIPYLKSCIKESIRLFPITIGTGRSLPVDIVLGGYMIPKGISINAAHGVMGLDPKQFPRPDEYIPERWLRDNEEFPSAKTAHPFAYMPFGFGARSCVGKRFAEMEMEIIGLKVIRNFKLEWHHGPLDANIGAINTIATPLQIKCVDVN